MATYLELEIPTDPVSRSSREIRERIASPIRRASPSSRCVPVRSRNASSRESGSTRGEKSEKIARSDRETSWYFRMFPGTITRSRQSLSAVAMGMAERTPNFRAS